MIFFNSRTALVHESELARNEPDSQVHHLFRALCLNKGTSDVEVFEAIVSADSVIYSQE